MAGISVGAVWLIQQLQSLRCPAGTFLYASGEGATALQFIPIFLASVGFGFLAINWLAHLVRPLRNFFDRDARHHREPGYHSGQRKLAKFAVIVLSMMLPISIAASFSQYCLSEREILYQRWPWTGLRRYLWQDVVAIETSCTHSKGGLERQLSSDHAGRCRLRYHDLAASPGSRLPGNRSCPRGRRVRV